MKKNKKIKLGFIIIILSILIIIYSFFNIKNPRFQDDIIFFKIFNQDKNNNLSTINNKSIKENSTSQYFFNVTYKGIDFKDINLLDTINRKTLINEKIAPGTSGQFDIILNSKEDINYEINFESLNQKPRYLKFNIKGDNREFDTLEELETQLKGSIVKNKTKNIHINWEWKYGDDLTKDIQDTKDGINIQKYNFKIYAYGK